MKVDRVLVMLLLTAIIAAPVGAQPPPPPPPDLDALQFSWTAVDGKVATFAQGIAVDPVGLLAVEPFEKPLAVKGAPYTAEAVTEVTQTLADGNRIQRRTTAKVARDSQGRVRREQQAMALGGLVAEAETVIVTISDPAAGRFITLNQGDKTAMQAGARRFDVMAERMGAAGTFVGPANVPPDPTGGMRAGGVVAIKPYAAAAEATLAVDTQSLGTQDIEGVRAEGTRTTTTIPAGAIGNELPIEMIGERWYSPELQVVVMTRRSDPRFGETVYRLTNIVRAEPPASLFQVPADYQVQEPKLVPPPPRIKPEGR